MPSSFRSNQLPLDLKVPASVSRDDLAESPANTLAISMIDAWPDWPGQMAIICGPEGAGKSHIAAAWRNQADAIALTPADIRERAADIQALLNDGLDLLVEDVDPDHINETAFFHFFNSVRQAQTTCLMTARKPPNLWDVSIPDLKSRLKVLQVVQISQPDDFLLKQVMFKLFSDRQLQVDTAVIDYLILRMERSLKKANTLVEAIDREALARKTAVTKILAGRILQGLEQDQ